MPEDEQIKISIIVPVYNTAPYLERCISSLCRQTMKEGVEILLIDDGSTDESGQICDRCALNDSDTGEKWPRIRTVHQENGGLGSARNAGLELAAGEYIAFVDSDDYVSENMCRLLYEKAGNCGADIVYGKLCRDENGKLSDIEKTDSGSEEILTTKEEMRALMLNLVATPPESAKDLEVETSVCRALFKRSLIMRHRIRFVSERTFISEDLIFDLELIPHCGCIVFMTDTVYFYCVNRDSLTRRYDSDRFKKEKAMIPKLTELLLTDGNCGSGEVQLRCDRFLLARARYDIRNVMHAGNSVAEKEKRSFTDRICNDSLLQEILRRYPYRKLPAKHVLVAELMRHRRTGLLMRLLSM